MTSKLVIVSVNEQLADQLLVTGLTDLIGADNLYRGNERIGAALDRAHRDAVAWVARPDDPDHDNDR